MSDPPRLTPLGPESLTEAQRRLHRAITRGARAGQPFPTTGARGELLGPFDALLRVPELGHAVQQVGQALRFAGVLPHRLRELVVLAVAAHRGSDYEWYAHTRVAAGLGVVDADLRAIRAGTVPESCDEAEADALRLAHALLVDRAVPADRYDAAVGSLAEDGVAELACLVGYYELLAGLLATFDVRAPS